MTLLVLVGFAFLVSCVVTGRVRRFALKHDLLDRPNARSSHTAPTPRGGGVAIVLALMLAMTALALLGWLPLNLIVAFAGGGLLVAVVGAWDDRRGVAASRRALVHAIAAGWGLLWIRGLQFESAFDVMTGVLEWIGLIWMINLYNFMDGIDGIAGLQAVFVSVAGTILFASSGSPLANLSVVIGAAAAGFLVWNWPPARIFMGDVASGFLGLIFGLLAIAGEHTGASSFWPWLILLGVFEVDATVTLLRRIVVGQRWYEAHRSHAYQHATRRWKSHLKVTLGVLVVNVSWLLPWAWVAWSGRLPGVIAAVVALVPLAIAALALRAGSNDD